MMTDPIADMLTRIRNAQMSRRGKVELPFSKMKKNIADLLSREGYLGKIEEVEAKPAKILVLELEKTKQYLFLVILKECLEGFLLKNIQMID